MVNSKKTREKNVDAAKTRLTLSFCDWWYTVRVRAIFLRTTAILASFEAAPPVTCATRS